MLSQGPAVCGKPRSILTQALELQRFSKLAAKDAFASSEAKVIAPEVAEEDMVRSLDDFWTPFGVAGDIAPQAPEDILVVADPDELWGTSQPPDAQSLSEVDLDDLMLGKVDLDILMGAKELRPIMELTAESIEVFSIATISQSTTPGSTTETEMDAAVPATTASGSTAELRWMLRSTATSSGVEDDVVMEAAAVVGMRSQKGWAEINGLDVACVDHKVAWMLPVDQWHKAVPAPDQYW